MPDAPVPRLADRIYGRILELIIDSSLQEGEQLPTESELSERFGASRPVIREALARLATDGVVTARRGSGTFLQLRPATRLTQVISGDSLAPAIGMFEVRAALEPAAAGLAALRRTADQLYELEAHFENIRAAAAGGPAPPEADHGFHFAIMRATNNPIFEDTYRQLSPLILEGMRAGLALSRAPELPAVDVEEHEAILRAIRARDDKTAELTMRWHLLKSRQRLLSRGAAASGGA